MASFSATLDNDDFLGAWTDQLLPSGDMDAATHEALASDSSSSTLAARPPSPSHHIALATPPRSTRRVPKKAVIAQLRVEAATLRETLMRARDSWQRKSALVVATTERACGENRTTLQPSTLLRDEWQRTALQQREALNRAEATNRELKRQVQLRRTRLQRVRKLLAKRAAIGAVRSVMIGSLYVTGRV